MSNAGAPILNRDCSLTISTGGTPLSLVILFDAGDIKVSGLNALQKEVETFMSRGEIYAARYSNDKPFTFEFSSDACQFLGDGTTGTLFEILMRKGVYAAATSTWPTAAGDVWMVQCSFSAERSNFGATADNTVTYKYVFFEIDYAEGVPGKFTCKGTVIPYSNDWATYA